MHIQNNDKYSEEYLLYLRKHKNEVYFSLLINFIFHVDKCKYNRREATCRCISCIDLKNMLQDVQDKVMQSECDISQL